MIEKEINGICLLDKKPFIVKDNGLSDLFATFLGKEEKDFLHIKTLRDIPAIFDKIPDEYINNVAHRGNYSEFEMSEKTEDGDKKLLHLDVDFGKRCKLNCPHCFKNNIKLNDTHKECNITELSQEDLKGIILRLKDLGLKTIKICGAGEPFDNKDFLPFLEFLHENGLGVSVFTKGYVLGNDEFVDRLYGHLGITTGLELCKKLKELDVSVLFGLNSFDSELQKQHSGVEKWDGYIEYRDQALINLINAGLNEYSPGEATRLSIVMAPVKPENLLESKDIYIRSRMRNIYPVCCPSNNAGLGKDENEKIVKEYGNYEKDLIKLYTDIYIRNIENGIITLESLEKEGIGLYPGAHPCTQTNIGVYMDLYGQVLSCPGHDTEDKKLKISKNILIEEDLKTMRKNSANYQRSGFNQKCIARDNIVLGLDFYDRIMKNVQGYFTK